MHVSISIFIQRFEIITWQGISSIFAGLDELASNLYLSFGIPNTDYGSRRPYLEFWRLDVRDAARIFKITRPLAWHDLCVRYPANGTGEHCQPDFSGDPGQIVPDWSAASVDWGAMRLTFGGLLTSDQVRIEPSAGWSYLWGWDVEQTMWLRWTFSESYHMGNHERVHPIYHHVHVDYRFQ